MGPLKQSFETWKRKYFCQGGEWYSHSKNNIDTVYSSSAAYVANSAFLHSSLALSFYTDVVWTHHNRPHSIIWRVYTSAGYRL